MMFFPGVGVAFFILIFSWTSVSSYELSFGCDVDALVNYTVHDPLRGEFGRLDLNDILAFKKEKYIKFLDKISSIFSEFKNNLEYSSLDSYYKFYQTYTAMKQCPGYTGFPEFYRRYLLENFPYDEAGGNAIKLMERLTKKFPKLAKSAYFVTRSQISLDDLESLKKRSATLDNLPGYFHEEQIAVVIKFRFEGERGYYGFIVLDPEMPMDKPAVLRLDSGVRLSQVAYEKVSFKIIEPLNKNLADSQFMTAAVTYRPRDRPTMFVYDFKRPYCTFVETTMKPSLLKYTHSKELQDNKGVSKAKLIANIGLSPSEGLVYKVEFLLYNQDRTNPVIIPLMTNIPYEIYSHMRELRRLCARMGINPENCQNSMVKEIKLLQAIYEDEEFINQCQQALWTPDVPCVDEENSSGAVLRALDPAATKKSSFKLPQRHMLWKYLEDANPQARCESYGYGPKK